MAFPISLGTALVVAGGAALAGSAISASSARSAARTQADAANRATDIQQQMFQQTRGDLQPWMQGGQQGLNALLPFLGLGQDGQWNPNAPGVRPFSQADFMADPGYQFRLNEGLNALLSKRSATGGIRSGNTMKDLLQYGQGFASNEWGNSYNRYNQDIANQYNRLAALSGTGANAAAGVGNIGANYAGPIGTSVTGAGNALAAGQAAQGAAWNQGLTGIGNNFLMASYMQNRGGTGAATPNPFSGAQWPTFNTAADMSGMAPTGYAGYLGQ